MSIVAPRNIAHPAITLRGPSFVGAGQREDQDAYKLRIEGSIRAGVDLPAIEPGESIKDYRQRIAASIKAKLPLRRRAPSESLEDYAKFVDASSATGVVVCGRIALENEQEFQWRLQKSILGRVAIPPRLYTVDHRGIHWLESQQDYLDRVDVCVKTGIAVAPYQPQFEARSDYEFRIQTSERLRGKG